MTAVSVRLPWSLTSVSKFHPAMSATLLAQTSCTLPHGSTGDLHGENGGGGGESKSSPHNRHSDGGPRSVLTEASRSKQQPPCLRERMYIGNNKPRAMDSSRIIAEDYVHYCLQKKGLIWPNGPREAAPNELQRAMRAMGDEFETRFNQSFDDMISELHITPDTAYQTFRTIVNEIFTGGVNWGRVVALFGFGGRLAVKCVEQSMPQLVRSIVDWLSDYVDTNLNSWMSQNNGWDGFLEFCQRDPENRKTESWPSLKRLCGYAAAGLGILTLGAILSQKS